MQTQILFNIHPNVLLDISTSSIREPHCSQTTQHKKNSIVEKAVIEFCTPSILTIQRGLYALRTEGRCHKTRY